MYRKTVSVSLIMCLVCITCTQSVPTGPKTTAPALPPPSAPQQPSEAAMESAYEMVKNILSDSELNATALPELLATTAVQLVDSQLQSVTLNADLYPTLHSALMAPISLLTRLLRDALAFYEHKSLTQLLSLSSLRSALVSAPQQLTRYWRRLMDMEQQCAYRTVCDLAAFLAPRLPFWANQLSGVYFTTNSANSEYYRAVANGMINRNCADYYGKCSLAGV